MKVNFKNAEHLFNDRFYEESFAMFNTIASDKKVSLELRAESCNMIGLIIQMAAPYLAKGDDESGLYYFKKALELDSKNISAALNIIATYDNSPTDHKNAVATKIAYECLKKYYWQDLSEEQKKSVHLLDKHFDII